MEDGEERTEYSYNGLNQLTASATMNLSGSTENKVSDKIYQYDANGNQVREADSITGEERQNTFDVENRLSQAVIKKGDVVSVDQRNEYNGEGQRIHKQDNEKVTEYFYEGASVLYTANDTGDKTGIHYMGLTGNIIAAQKKDEEGEFAAYLYNKNVQGSTTGLIASDGTNALSYRYDDFGNTEVFGDTVVENEICYTGGIYDAATGEYYLNARYYDPEDGRFVTQDTYRGEKEKQNTWHLYAYCNNNPVNFVDPTGHDAIVLKSNFASRFVGHMAVLIQDGSNWKYFSWAAQGYKSPYMCKKANTKRIKSVKKRKVYSAINKRFNRKKKSEKYRKYIVLRGKFSGSLNYMYRVKNGKGEKHYTLTGVNCAWMVIQVLKHNYSPKGSRYKKLHNMQWYWKGLLKTVIPDKAFTKLAKLYGAKIKNVK